MHAIAFGCKRTFHSFVRVTRRPLLAWPGLTAARFDMLSAFLTSEYTRPESIALRQSELRRKLGVCASVVSRMVRVLVQLGWLSRERDPRDTRTWRLALTAAGEGVIRSARRFLLRPVARLVDAALGLCRRCRERRFEDLLIFTSSLDAIRRAFADRATLDYPWWHNPIDH